MARPRSCGRRGAWYAAAGVDIRFPEPLRAGSVVAVVAPAGPAPREELLRGLAWLRTRYELRVADDLIAARSGFLAGADGRRARELSAAFSDPSVDAVLCARGGYGTMRILDVVDWSAFVARPRWIVGFSDITALHVTAFQHGVASIHGPNVTGIGRESSVRERAALLAALERPHDAVSVDALEVLHGGGKASGPVFGGNLALLEAMAAAGRLRVPDGAIVLLEDVTEKPYRIDRMLTSLLLGGHLSRASAIVLGAFTECPAGPDGTTARDVLVERTRALGVPVCGGAPFGHEAPNDAFVHGRIATLETSPGDGTARLLFGG